MNGENPRYYALAQALLVAWVLLMLLAAAAILVVFSPPDAARALRLTGLTACAVMAWIGANRLLLRAGRSRIQATMTLSLGVFIASIVADIALGAITLPAADSAAAWDAAVRRVGWLPLLIDATRSVSLGVLIAAVTARFRQSSRQP